MAETNFPLYREQAASRISANNAMMAILAGSRLASHTLKLTEGSALQLGKIFPGVQHIERFNLTTESAGSILRSADGHIAAVAIPYALATHEAFVLDLLDLASAELGVSRPSVKAWNMHEKFFEVCSFKAPDEDLEIFHTLRELRNCIIHSHGFDKQGRLHGKIQDMGAAANSEWERLNLGVKAEDLLDTTGMIHLDVTHIFSAFAISKSLARKMNEALTQGLSRETWARVSIQDFASNTKKLKNSSAWRRAALGYVKMHYGPTNLTEQDVENAARSTGLWSAATWK